jgi:hypothetical protein
MFSRIFAKADLLRTFVPPGHREVQIDAVAG